MHCRPLARGRPVVPGEALGEAVVVERFSLYGDLDPQRGTLAGRPVAGRVLVAGRHVGSTVGAYVLYAAAKRGAAPAAIVVGSLDTVLVSGAVLAGVPLVAGPDPRALAAAGLRDGSLARVSRDGTVSLCG